MPTGERKEKNLHRADNAFIGLIGTKKYHSCKAKWRSRSGHINSYIIKL